MFKSTTLILFLATISCPFGSYGQGYLHDEATSGTHAQSPSLVHSRYLEMFEGAPQQEEIKLLCSEGHIALNKYGIFHVQIENLDDEWLPQFEDQREYLLENISGEQENLDKFWTLLKESVEHSLQVLSSQIQIKDHLPVKISIRVHPANEPSLDKPRWHTDLLDFHLLISLFGERGTLYHGPANTGDQFAEYFDLNMNKLETGSVVEAPQGKYIFSSQGVKPVYHASPIAKQSGRVVLVLQIGKGPSTQEWLDEYQNGPRPR